MTHVRNDLDHRLQTFIHDEWTWEPSIAAARDGVVNLSGHRVLGKRGVPHQMIDGGGDLIVAALQFEGQVHSTSRSIKTCKASLASGGSGAFGPQG